MDVKQKHAVSKADALPTERNIVSWKSLRGLPLRLGINAVKQLFCPKATDAEAIAFIYYCRSHQLDPFAGEVFLVKYDEKAPAKIVVSRDHLIARAQQVPGYEGFLSGVIVKRRRNEFTRALDELMRELEADNYELPDELRKKLLRLGELAGECFPEWMEIEGAFVPDGYELVGGWCRVFVTGQQPTYVRVMLKEYDKGQASWRQMPATMIVKVAEAQAHRKKAPTLVGGMYTPEEFGELSKRDIVDVEGHEVTTAADDAAELNVDKETGEVK